MKCVAGLYAIADTRYLDDARLLPAMRAVIEGGARIVQYRDKSDDRRLREHQAAALAALCRETDTTFLVNDDVALARATAADGVHIGREDASLAAAREQLGPGAIIGVSCYNELGHALHAQEQGADYVAFGSFYPSRTKPQAVSAGIELLHAARGALRIPIVAIGGITPENGAELVAAGADALAVIEGLLGQADARGAAMRYRQLFVTHRGAEAAKP